MSIRFVTALCLVAVTPLALAADKKPPASATIYLLTAEGVGDPIGSIAFADSNKGLVITTKLSGLTPGEHGFHIHELADCRAVTKDGVSTAGMAAGGHFDPTKTGKHLGPMGEGHRGDLPLLKVATDGKANDTLLAPHLTVAELKDHSVMIHQNGDNYSDDPKPVGGGGPRIACGVVEIN